MAAPSDTGWASGADALVVEAKIPLGDVSGRIDHLAFDEKRRRVYIAELGNNSVGIVDLSDKPVARIVPGFDEPQGIGYEPASDTVYVAGGGDGSVRLFSGKDFTPVATIALGQDADNVRVDQAANRVYVGYGDGALAAIDSRSRKRLTDISLTGHPESFQLSPVDDRIFVNVPDKHEIAVVSRASSRQVGSWPTGDLRSNYPLALDAEQMRVLSVFRRPARVQAYDMHSGKAVAGIDVCGDSDDIFMDRKRHRIYAVCGEGFVDVFDSSKGTYAPIGRTKTSVGSRTGLFVPELDRLLVAIRASDDGPASLWILRPTAQ